ncbi:hypothetical protein [Thermaerobacter litoralis]
MMMATALYVFTAINAGELANSRIRMMLDAAATAGAAYGATISYSVTPTGTSVCTVDIDPQKAEAAALTVWSLNANHTGWDAIGVENTGLAVDVVTQGGQKAVRVRGDFRQYRPIGPGGLFRDHFVLQTMATVRCQ